MGEKFNIRNPLTWSKTIMADIETQLLRFVDIWILYIVLQKNGFKLTRTKVETSSNINLSFLSAY